MHTKHCSVTDEKSLFKKHHSTFFLNNLSELMTNLLNANRWGDLSLVQFTQMFALNGIRKDKKSFQNFDFYSKKKKIKF